MVAVFGLPEVNTRISIPSLVPDDVNASCTRCHVVVSVGKIAPLAVAARPKRTLETVPESARIHTEIVYAVAFDIVTDLDMTASADVASNKIFVAVVVFSGSVCPVVLVTDVEYAFQVELLPWSSL